MCEIKKISREERIARLAARLTEAKAQLAKTDRKERNERLTKMLQICNTSGRGVWKRIDENRELLYFLYEHAPDLFERFGFIRGWIQSNDDFFTELAEVSRIENYHSPDRFPRPFPSEEVFMAYKRERDDILISYKEALKEQNRLLIENQKLIAAFNVLFEDLKTRLSNKPE